MAVGVVELLEVVDINQQQGKMGIGCPRGGPGVVDFEFELATIRNTSQAVQIGQFR